MKRSTKIVVVAALAALTLTSTGCFRRVPLERAQRIGDSSESVKLGSAEALALNVRMGAGELHIGGEGLGEDAVRGRFDYTQRLRPRVTSSTEGTAVVVDVEQPEFRDRLPFGNMESTWDLRLREGLPAKLVLKMGAGDAKIDLSRVNVTDLSMVLGAGKTDVDLSGDHSNAINAVIQAGAGEIIIRLPRDIPVRVTGARDGIGGFSAEGFVTEGDVVMNEAARTGSPLPGSDNVVGSIDLNVQRGVGDVRLELVD